MCGRYNFTAEDNEAIERIVQEISKRFGPDAEYKTGEIFPTNTVPILTAGDTGVGSELISWGFPRFQSKSGVIINARQETAFERPMFKKSLTERRCVVPTSGFYEWDDSKQKHIFNKLGTPVLYLAGFHNTYKGDQRFVILTREANESVQPYHHRMPVILDEQQVDEWVQTDNLQAVHAMMQNSPTLINKTA